MTDKEARALILLTLLPAILGNGNIGDSFKALLADPKFLAWLIGKIA